MGRPPGMELSYAPATRAPWCRVSKNRWIDDLQADLRALSVDNRHIVAHDRAEWGRILRQVWGIGLNIPLLKKSAIKTKHLSATL